MDDRVRIVSMDARPRLGSVLASFEAQVNGMLLKRCAIIRAESGHVIAVPPRSLGDTPEERAVMFSSHGLKAEFTEKALSTFKAMGGEVVHTVTPDTAHLPRNPPAAWLRSEIVAAG